MIKNTLIACTLLNCLALRASEATTIPLAVFFDAFNEEIAVQAPLSIGSDASTAPTVPLDAAAADSNREETASMPSGNLTSVLPDDLTGVSVGDFAANAQTASPTPTLAFSAAGADPVPATPEPITHQNAVIPAHTHPAHQALGHIALVIGDGTHPLAQVLHFPAQTQPAHHVRAQALNRARCHTEPLRKRS